MLYSILLCMALSLLIIMLSDKFYEFLKNTLTVPKVKDLVNKPKKNYDDILEKIKESEEEVQINDITPPIDTMKDELSLYLDELNNPQQ
jgi:DNA-binding transcriptional regulator GbsR (MarR family)